ncbi:hypothetical protein, partial [Lactococcus petauri]|uniref:hypothetical protein n=1 Tax=Lactococcus petauri TaxID=1940789 RepID=UPI00254D8211
MQNKVSQYPYSIFVFLGLATRVFLKSYEVKIGDRFVPPLVLSDLEEKLSKCYFVLVMSAIALVFVFVFGRNTYFANTYCLVFIVFLIFAIANIFWIKKKIKKLEIEDQTIYRTSSKKYKVEEFFMLIVIGCLMIVLN